jgi:hypothetical protein
VSFCPESFFYSDFSQPFVSIKLLSCSPTRDVRYLRPQTEFNHASHTTPLWLSILSGDAKRTVIFCPESIFYSDFYSPFFRLNCCLVPQLATWDISAHKQDITTPLTPLPPVTLS